MAYDLEGLAAAEDLSGHRRTALVYLGAAERLRDEAGSPISPVERAALARAMGPSPATITPAEEREAQAEGQTRPLEAIVASVLELWPEEGDETQV